MASDITVPPIIAFTRKELLAHANIPMQKIPLAKLPNNGSNWRATSPTEERTIAEG